MVCFLNQRTGPYHARLYIFQCRKHNTKWESAFNKKKIGKMKIRIKKENMFLNGKIIESI